MELLTRLQTALGDRYRIEREIGAGGMATVYLAKDLRHDRDVALKVLRPELAAVMGGERFLNEIRIAAQLDHPHILTLIDSGADDTFLWYVLPYVRGESLRAKLERERQLSLEESLQITQQIASALDYAHRRAVIHRDIKPENILLHEGEAVLADFGIALAVKEAAGNRLTETGLSLGTPQYMSPEQATASQQLDGRSDVYSLGAVLFEMLAGEPPYSGATAQAIIAKLMTERPMHIRTVRDTVPEAMDDAVAKALSKVPADRFPTAGAFVASLAASAGALARPKPARRPWLAAAVVAGVVLAGIAGVLLARRSPSRAAPFTPQLAQLTTDGNARLPALSPDGRLAFVARDCDAQERCTERLVVQDTGGAGSITVLRGNAIWAAQWTTGGRYLAATVLEPSGMRLYAVPALGGTPRMLGCCFGMPVGSTDTLLVSPYLVLTADSVLWMRFLTVSDGIVRDSVPVRRLGFVNVGYPARASGRIAVVRYQTPSDGSLWLLDRSGQVTDSLPEMLRFAGFLNWSPSDDALIWPMPLAQVGVYNAYGVQSRVMIARRRITADGRFIGGVDTLMRLQQGASLSTLNPDGTAILTQGPVDVAVSVLERARPGVLDFRTRQLAASTAGLHARLSRDGAQVWLLRPSEGAGGSGLRHAFVPFDGGPERAFVPPPGDLFSWDWTRPVSSELLVASRDSLNQVRLFELTVATGRVRELASLPDGTDGIFAVPGGGFGYFDFQTGTAQVRGRPGKADTTWLVPAESGRLSAPVDVVPGGSGFLAFSMSATTDTVWLSSVPYDGRSAVPLATITPGYPLWMSLLPDRSVEYGVLESATAAGWYRIPPAGGRAVRLGDAPVQGTTIWSMSEDGRRALVVKSADRPDVYLVRNFGELLRPR